MSAEEYRERNNALMEQIEHYQADNAEHEVQIALNNKAIVELDIKRRELYKEYAYEPAQRGLQGNVIKKGK